MQRHPRWWNAPSTEEHDVTRPAYKVHFSAMACQRGPCVGHARAQAGVLEAVLWPGMDVTICASHMGGHLSSRSLVFLPEADLHEGHARVDRLRRHPRSLQL